MIGVAEIYDLVLKNIKGQHVLSDYAIEVLNAAKPGPVAEGSSGGGNWMIY